MTIDINGISSPKTHGVGDDKQVKQPVDQQQEKPDAVQSSASDSVSLSDNAVQLGKLDNSAIETPVVDAQRVEQVKQAISSGTYEVDAKKVADKLMQFESILKSDK